MYVCAKLRHWQSQDGKLVLPMRHVECDAQSSPDCSLFTTKNVQAKTCMYTPRSSAVGHLQ